ncbi:UBP-type zinc finger domain-containing protein [Cupriavidus metallidurans]|uniref:UBP-type zinc finger domain-containing protein n=1 Tax=Cupriavidus metallidurans TaxID=119219 RepID=UPI003CFE9EBE
MHLRLCRACGHVGCCDNSPLRHARAHYEKTGHPIIEGYDTTLLRDGGGATSIGRKSRFRTRRRSEGRFHGSSDGRVCSRAALGARRWMKSEIQKI